jgi:SAM-dependent methyltransferase
MYMDDNTRRYYREQAENLAEMYDAANPSYLKQLMTLLPGGSWRILDVGCGTGRDMARLMAAGYDAVGVDSSAEMVEAGRLKYTVPDRALRVDSLPDLSSLGNEQFDAVLCAAVLQHIVDSDLPAAIRRLRSLITPGGCLVLSVPVAYPLAGPAVDHQGRLFHLRAPEQYVSFLEGLGLALITSYDEEDGLGRPERLWRVLVFRAGESRNL